MTKKQKQKQSVMKTVFTWCKFWVTFQTQAWNKKKIIPWNTSEKSLYFEMDADFAYLTCFDFLHPQNGCWFSLPSQPFKTNHEINKLPYKTTIYQNKTFLINVCASHLAHSPKPILRKNSHAFLRKIKQKQKILNKKKIIITEKQRISYSFFNPFFFLTIFGWWISRHSCIWKLFLKR